MKKAVILFDSECGMCSRFKKGIEMLDKGTHIEFVSIHEASAFVRFPELNKEECEDVVHLVDEDGKVHKGGEVISYLVKLFPQAEKFAWLLENDRAKGAMDAFYGQLNDMRIMQRNKCFRCGTKSRNKR